VPFVQRLSLQEAAEPRLYKNVGGTTEQAAEKCRFEKKAYLRG
jgi:hypothetical protein